MMLTRLWPVLLVTMLLILWRLWFLRVRGEGDAESTAAARQYWKRALLACVAVLVGMYLAILTEGRPQTGAYHPARMNADGSLTKGGME